MRPYLILVGLLWSLVGLSQNAADYSKCDKWVSSFTPSNTNIPELTIELMEGTSDDHEKIRRIFQFITLNISYDQEAYRSGNKRINRTSDDILKRRKAVCWGFSQLLREMSLEAGIPAYTVVGYCKPAHIAEPDFRKPDHAWNVVQLEEAYYLIDATWAVNIPEQREAYFLADPEWFVSDHYPVWKGFQLLPCPVGLLEFVEGDFSYNSTREEECAYSFRDSIEVYADLPYSDQRLFEQEIAKLENPTTENRSQYGHALFDQGLALKEVADSLLERNQWITSIEFYESAIENFEAGNEYTTTYPWQAEAFGFTHFNYGMALYQSGGAMNRERVFRIRQAFTEAQRILTEVVEKSIFVNHALETIEQNLAVLK